MIVAVLFKVKQKALVLAEMQEFVQHRQEDDNQLHNDIDELIEAINKSVLTCSNHTTETIQRIWVIFNTSGHFAAKISSTVTLCCCSNVS